MPTPMHCSSNFLIILTLVSCILVQATAGFSLWKPSTTASPLRIWIDEHAYGSGETQLLREAAAASNGAAVIAGETRVTFLASKGWHNLKEVDIYWTGRQGCYAAFRQSYITPTHAISCVPGTQSITGKASLVSTLTTAYGSSNAFQLIPPSYLLPKQYYALAQQVTSQKRKEPWILKEDAHRGKGVHVAQGSEVLEKAREKENHSGCAGGRNSNNVSRFILAQKFMKDQYLVNNRPFYIRLWAVVAGGSPIRAFLFKGGVVVFGEEQNQTKQHRREKQSQQVNTDSMVVNLWIQDRKSAAPWSLKQLQDHITATTGSFEAFNSVWNAIERSVATTIAAAAPTIRATTSKDSLPYYNQAGFEFLGFDFLVDSTMKPWLIEVNWLPSLARKVIGCGTRSISTSSSNDGDDTKKNTTKEECQRDNPFDQQKEAFVSSLLQLLIQRHQGHESRLQQAEQAIATLKQQQQQHQYTTRKTEQRTTTTTATNTTTSASDTSNSSNSDFMHMYRVCLSADQLRRVLDTRHESSIASSLGFSVLNEVVYRALQCMDSGSSSTTKESNECDSLFKASTPTTSSSGKKTKMFTPRLALSKRILRFILRNLPLLNRLVPRSPSYVGSMTEYDKIVGKWLVRDHNDGEMEVLSLLQRMCHSAVADNTWRVGEVVKVGVGGGKNEL